MHSLPDTGCEIAAVHVLARVAVELLYRSKLNSVGIMRTLGIVLLLVGIVMTVFTGFTLITKEEVVDLGSVEINRKKKTPIYWSPVTGAILMAGGVVILFVGGKKKI